MSVRLLAASKRMCNSFRTGGPTYNLPGKQTGLSHGLPLCSEVVRPVLLSSSCSRCRSEPLRWGHCVCWSLLSWPLWMPSCWSACPPDFSRVTRLYPPPVSGILSFLFSSCAEPVPSSLASLTALCSAHLPYILTLLFTINVLHLPAATSLTTIMMIITVIRAGESAISGGNYRIQSLSILTVS